MANKKISLSKREKNLLIGLISTAVIFIAWMFYFEPLLDEMSEKNDELQQLENEIDELEQRAEQKPFIEDELERLQEIKDDFTTLLPPPDNLQTVLFELRNMLEELPIEKEGVELGEYDYEMGDEIAEKLVEINDDKEDVDELDDMVQDALDELVVLPGEASVSAQNNEDLLLFLDTLENFSHFTVVETLSWDKEEHLMQTVEFKIFFIKD